MVTYTFSILSLQGYIWICKGISHFALSHFRELLLRRGLSGGRVKFLGARKEAM